MEKIHVSLAHRSYDIEIGFENFAVAGSILTSFDRISRGVILTDTNVHHFGYATQVAESISEAGINTEILTIQAGEQSKSIETAATLWETLLEVGADRRSVLVAVGGGVIGDLSGFVAATFARGIRFFQVPTTLLAQVDSSVGGKVGIDLPTAKNMVGTFHQPLGVLIDTHTLQTLPADQYASGLGEVVKYAVSLDAELFGLLETNVEKIRVRDTKLLRQVIAACCRIKAKIVEQDEFEMTGLRTLLNYGHTFGHAFESLSDYSLPHGLAVSIGSICTAKLARQLGMIDDTLLERQLALYRALNLPTEPPKELDLGQAIDRMRHDKKSEFGQLRFVLPTALGQCKVVDDIDASIILPVLRKQI